MTMSDYGTKLKKLLAMKIRLQESQKLVDDYEKQLKDTRRRLKSATQAVITQNRELLESI
jgi:hypothetical protein